VHEKTHHHILDPYPQKKEVAPFKRRKEIAKICPRNHYVVTLLSPFLQQRCWLVGGSVGRSVSHGELSQKKRKSSNQSHVKQQEKADRFPWSFESLMHQSCRSKSG